MVKNRRKNTSENLGSGIKFYKLLDDNIDDTSFIAITEMYKNVTSSVRYTGLTSESFPIQQVIYWFVFI